MMRTPRLYTVIFNAVIRWKLEAPYVCIESDNSNHHNSIKNKISR